MASRHAHFVLSIARCVPGGSWSWHLVRSSRRTVDTHQAAAGQASGMAKRRELRGVRLTEEAFAGLDALATRGHCTRNAMIEALGQAGREGRPIVWDDIVAEALRIDRRRLSRR